MSRWPHLGASALVIVSLAATSDARAERANDELTALERELGEEHAALSTADCVVACRALASILRAADKLCALDPADRCVAARAKADEATRRVRDACPDCAIASAPPRLAPPGAPHEERAVTKVEAAPRDSATPATASAPPSESKRGGCAGCATTSAAPRDLTAPALAMIALAFAARRRRRSASRCGDAT